jgi:hypothetical protein
MSTTLRLNKTTTLQALQDAKLQISSQLGTRITNDDFIMYLLSTTVSKTGLKIDTSVSNVSKIEPKVDTPVDYCIYNLDTSVSSVDTSNFVTKDKIKNMSVQLEKIQEEINLLLKFKKEMTDLDLTKVMLKGNLNSDKLNVIEDKLGI